MITVALGSTVEDIVSGFRGVVTSRVEYINGCTQYGVQPWVSDLDSDGKMLKVVYLDEARLKVDTTVEIIKPILTFGEQSEGDHASGKTSENDQDRDTPRPRTGGPQRDTPKY